MWKLQVLGLLVLGCCGVLFVSGESVQTEGTTAANNGDVVTLSTELKPPPLPAASEHYGIVYLVNLFAVRNKTTATSDENGENTLADSSPEIIGPLASVLLLVDEEDDEKVTSENLSKNLGEDYATDESTDSKETPKEIETDAIVSENRDVTVGKTKKLKKIRSKRTTFKKCGGYGGYPSGSYGGGGGYGAVAVPIFVVPVGVYGGGRGGGQGHYGGGGGYHGGGGYGQQFGGYNQGGGGWGGGSQASAQASAQSSSW
ncbi:glycine-rich RNA-binding, abscisic acid-inducible protein-like isoform X2 [Diprion similis]|uniref:glycine-rich RNA-binding, abscisic acid-inducible protein-like isoform X2 n=1 Tax=Diprion similis TaxID=362088 RepID=UPI001EF86E20|nr:glycine-rich RNA-binding, abscisic acid-inducible protein-like isoform X2 [Diprion similis]